MLSGEDFAAVLKSRDRRRSSHFSLHWLYGPGPGGRLGLVVPKRLARTAVRRNLIKRQARALFRAWAGSRAVAGAAGSIAPDVVLKLTAGVAGLERSTQFAEMGGLMQALPRA
jgi:ribonuclease P protein component